MCKKVISIIGVLIFFLSASAQSQKEKRPTYINLDTLESSQIFKIWELYPMDSNRVYFSSIELRNEKFSERDKKNYIKLIRESKRHKPKELYLIFELGKRYKIDTLRSDLIPSVNSLIIEEVDLDSYRKPQGSLTAEVGRQLLMKRFMIFRYKEIDRMRIR